MTTVKILEIKKTDKKISVTVDMAGGIHTHVFNSLADLKGYIKQSEAARPALDAVLAKILETKGPKSNKNNINTSKKASLMDILEYNQKK